MAEKMASAIRQQTKLFCETTKVRVYDQLQASDSCPAHLGELSSHTLCCWQRKLQALAQLKERDPGQHAVYSYPNRTEL